MAPGPRIKLEGKSWWTGTQIAWSKVPRLSQTITLRAESLVTADLHASWWSDAPPDNFRTVTIFASNKRLGFDEPNEGAMYIQNIASNTWTPLYTAQKDYLPAGTYEIYVATAGKNILFDFPVLTVDVNPV